MENWFNQDVQTFEFEGRKCVVAVPEIPDSARRWVWRAEFFGAFPQVDEVLLKRGYHIIHGDFSDQFGCPQILPSMKKFHDFITKKYSLSFKAVMFGFSRGGLYTINYAVAYPDDISAIYLDAPVLDIFSWPKGGGAGVGSPRNWEICKTLYGVSNTDVWSADNPVNSVKRLFNTGIPVIMVAGDSDEVVPFKENGKILADYFKKEGREIPVFLKPGCKHHPHSLDDPTPICDFLLNL